MRRRLVTLVGTTLTILALTASSALAHYCYNASRSDRGNEAAGAHSTVFVTVGELIDMLPEFTGLCPDGVEYLHAWAAEEGLADRLVHTRAVMAGGAEGSTVSLDGQGVDHLPDGALGAAFGECTGT